MAQVSWLDPKVGGHLALFLHSSREPLSSKHDDSTINNSYFMYFIIYV